MEAQRITRPIATSGALAQANLPPVMVQAEHVDKVFAGDVGVFDLNFEVPTGTIFGMIGPSGCGKTTTVRLLTGLYKPDRGGLRVLGRTPHKFSPRARERLGYMPQHFVLYPNLTVWENLNFVASLYGMGYFKRRQHLEWALDFVELSLPPQHLPTVAAVCTVTPEALARNGIDPLRIPGSLHAAEHAAIGLLPLVASCDRADIGGLSTAIGPGGLPTVFVYDGYPGGAGFAERGYRQAATWLGATLAAISACECPNGCPSCVQSPKCGNGNDPLDKMGAIAVLRTILTALEVDRPLDGRLPE